jgi:hypothetical protein
MRRKYKIVGSVLIAFVLSSCSPEDNKVMTTLSGSVKVQKDKCCTSNIPARFPVKSNNIPRPATDK